VVTIRDVAVHAGVSPATVSRVVNGLVGYSDETRERVETAVKSLSYETDYLARGLKTRQTSVIGLLAPMVSDVRASQVMQGVEEEAQAGELSALTHADPDAQEACGLWCVAIREAVLTGRLDVREGCRCLPPTGPPCGRSGWRSPSGPVPLALHRNGWTESSEKLQAVLGSRT
jgi:transcriptional regulator with XRE-family HTH domain